MMAQLFFLTGSLLAALGVDLGAFGAHGLRARLRPERLETFETGVRYHLIHALGLVAAGLAGNWLPGTAWLNAAGWLFVAGILLFSGSLYLLSVSGRRWLGAVTPFGGLALIAGWVCLALAAV
jgi:uncharacterized membrane protein YgdD (TMEM256/DUF423 family)